MSIITASGAFYNYIKSNGIIDKVFYIEADRKGGQPYVTVEQVSDPDNNTFLCEDIQGDTSFLIGVFQSSYTKGINNRQLLIDYIKELRTQTKNGFKFWNVVIVDSWDGDKNIDNLYTFNFEVSLKWIKL